MRPGATIGVLGLANAEDDCEQRFIGPVITVQFDFKKGTDMDAEQMKM